MIVYRANELDVVEGLPRAHPWTTTPDGKGRYVDFRANPEMIATSLEDFRPWEHYPAVKRFYDLLTWLNGPDSFFETNDAAFRIGPNNTPEQPFPLQADARLMLFVSDLRLTCTPGFTEWLMNNLGAYLQRFTPRISGAVGISKAPCFFRAASKRADELLLHFWAWGNTEEDALAILDIVFERLWAAFRSMNEDVRDTLEALEAQTSRA